VTITENGKKAIQLAFALLQLCEPMIEAQRPVEAILIGGVFADGARTV
jgi:hypothetical protein